MIRSLGLLFVIFLFCLSCENEKYIKNLQIEDEQISIQLQVRFQLFSAKDHASYRKMKLVKGEESNSIRLLNSNEGETEIRVYFLERAEFKSGNTKNVLFFEDGWMTTVIDYDSLNLVSMKHADVRMEDEFLNFSSRICLGKFYRNKFVDKNCVIESY